jgi:tripartite-type tricarboxylate transporter receptor subunit TctC
MGDRKVFDAMSRALLLLFLALPVQAQTWPSKPVRLIVPYALGGTTDIMARVLQPKLSASIGQPVVVENRAGGNTVIGAEIVARAAADGYTLMLTTAATTTLNQYTLRKLPFDPAKDFTPIAATGRSRGYVVVHPSLPVASLPQLLDYGRKNPGKLSYGTPNVSSSFHLSGALIQEAAGVPLVHVPYKGGSEAMRALVGGEIPMAILSNGSSMTSVIAGKVRLIAVLDADRDPKWPDVASVSESIPGFERTADWTGIYGPAGLQRPLVMRLNAEIVAGFNAPESVERLGNLGLVPQKGTPEDFQAMIARAIEVHGRAVRAAGIKPE